MLRRGDRPSFRLAIALVGAGTALAGSVHAEPPSAADIEREARSAYEHREFAVAARGFEAAHRAEPHAALKFNAALAWELAGDPARAADDFAAALAAGDLDPQQAKQARARLQELEQRLGTLDLEGAPGTSVRVDGEPAGALPARLHVLPGEHGVEVVWASGEREAQRPNVRAGEAKQLTFAAPPPPPPPSPEPAAPLPAPAPEAPPPSGSGLRAGGWVALGLGVASAGAAVGVGVWTLSARNDYTNLLHDPAASYASQSSAHDEAVTLRTATNVCWGLAAAGLVTGGALLLASLRGRGAAHRAALQIAPTGASLHLTF